MESHTLDMILTTVVVSFWVLFPIGMFLSIAHIEKNGSDVAFKETPRKNPRVSQRPTLIPH